MKIEKFTDRLGEFRFRIKARNGHVIAGSSQGYHDATHRDNMIAKLKEEMGTAVVVEVAE